MRVAMRALKLHFLLLITLLLGVACPSRAASLSIEPHAGYQRFNFNFPKPATLQMSNAEGVITLRFSQALEGSVAEIGTHLGSELSNVTQSADKKTVTITLKHPVRARRFISGNTIGVDLFVSPSTTPPVATPATAAPTAAAKPAPATAAITSTHPSAPAAKTPSPSALILTTRKSVPPAPSTGSPSASPAAAPPPASASAAGAPSPFKKPLVMKPVRGPVSKAAPITPVEQREAAAPKDTVKPPPANTYTTKKDTESAAHAATSTVPAAPPAPAKPEASPVKQPPAAEAKAPPAEPAPAQPDSATAKTAATAAAKEPASTTKKPFLVTVRPTKEGFLVNFPWTERTALAVFERPRAIWIIFSREAAINTTLLSTVMPKQVVRMQQYFYPGALVLKLSTDGTLHPTVTQNGKNYEWNVVLGAQAHEPSQNTAMHADASGDQHYLLMDVFDVGEPLTFFDPTTQDRIVAIPAYEFGRGVKDARDFPEFHLLPTQQGITVISERPDLEATALRQGLKLYAPNGSLSISPDLPNPSPPSSEKGQEARPRTSVLLPYSEWFVEPRDFYNQHAQREVELRNASTGAKPDAMMRLVALYLGQGMAAEGHAYLQLIKQQYPEYYDANGLALLSAASNLLMHRYAEATEDIADKHIHDDTEALMWRELITAVSPPVLANATALLPTSNAQAAAPAGTETPAASAPAATASPVAIATPAVAFDFAKYQKSYIRYYPPRVRQQIVEMVARANLKIGKENDALAAYDTLSTDGILGPLESEAELIVAMIAEKKDKVKEALDLYDRLIKSAKTPHSQAAARFRGVMLRYTKGKITSDEAIDALELARYRWRGDDLERTLLEKLAQVYSDAKRYDGTLRCLRAIIEAFPSDPDYLKLSTDMSDLFENLFLNGQADEMPPLKSLALFYEFRDLTPIGEKGDTMIQKLADRLAAVDLLDRAIQLLESQVRFRTSGEARARIGGRLSLLYLLNDQPEKAISTLEITNFSGGGDALIMQRNRIAAKALSRMGKPEEALGLISHDKTQEGNLLRLEILWAAKDWPNIINQAEDILSNRANLTSPLTPQETDVLLKLVLGYNFEGDSTQLRYLHDYYAGLLPDSAYKQIFEYLTNDTSALDTEDYAMIANQISHTELFLGTFKEKIAKGKLSESVQ